MKNKQQVNLSKRETQIMSVVYKRKKVSVKDVWDEIPDFPSYSAVRSILSVLVKKGFLKNSIEGKKYIYFAVLSRNKAMLSDVKNLMTTYFDNSLEKAITAMFQIHSKNLTIEKIGRIERIIQKRKKEVDEGDAGDD